MFYETGFIEIVTQYSIQLVLYLYYYYDKPLEIKHLIFEGVLFYRNVSIHF